MKVIIAGSRTITDYNVFEKIITKTFNDFRASNFDDIDVIVSGCANGVDTLAINYANKWNIPVKKFPADWEKYGKSAGYKRNEEMAKYADWLIAVWNGKSKGTGHMINLAEKYNLKITVVRYGEIND